MSVCNYNVCVYVYSVSGASIVTFKFSEVLAFNIPILKDFLNLYPKVCIIDYYHMCVFIYVYVTIYHFIIVGIFEWECAAPSRRIDRTYRLFQREVGPTRR